ncbi:MAG TPA: protein kinase [Candidatus Acidoferrales bacterium]|jgi:eukaryotic-like serine/threonine-protein kinase|nr:protein kinase [Candidatus Acidoferrales bacterium]
MTLQTGARLGPYEIVGPLGAGGMGEVYRARDTRLDRTVAIKILPALLSGDSARKQRFEREAKAISGLNHPHICVLYDVGHQDGMDYLVMECVQGETLAKRLERGALPVDQVLKIGMQLADALDKAHRSGIIHRDLKPGNIMLTAEGAKLLDFGLAKPAAFTAETMSMNAKPSDAVTAQGEIIGTIPYMCPEQVEGKELDARSDLFSLGAVLYEVLTAHRAFPGKSQWSVASAILEKDPRPIEEIKPMSPAALGQAIRRCLAKEPDDRWQTARDLELELKWIGETGAKTDAAAPAAAGKAWKKWMPWAAAAILALAGVALGMRLNRGATTTTQTIRAWLLPPPGSSYLPQNFAISPDGSRLAFVALDAEGKTALWVRTLSAAGAQELNGTEGALYPFWAPDNRRVGFFAQGHLKTVDISGGAVQVVCESLFAWGGSWNRDDAIVFTPNLVGPLYRVTASGGTPTPVTKVVSEGSLLAHRWPFFLPDGEHFLYFVDWGSADDVPGDGIYVGSIKSGESKKILAEHTGNVEFANGELIYVHDGTLVAQPFDTSRLEITGAAVPIAGQEMEVRPTVTHAGFSVSENGMLIIESSADAPSHLVWYDASGKELGIFPEVGYNDPEFSPDGRLLAVSSDDRRNGKHFIRVYDLQRGISSRLTEGGREHYPAWSRDGKQISFRGSGMGEDSYVMAADGSGQPKKLIKSEVGPFGWSLDGHMVYMTWEKGGAAPSVAVSSPGDGRLVAFESNAVEPKFSPNGKWIAFVTVGGGVAIRPYPGPGAKMQVTGDGAQPRWSWDGRMLFSIQRDRKLAAVDFDPEKGTVSSPRVVFQTRIVATNLAGDQYDVNRDGRFLINSLPMNTATPLTLIANWGAGLKK